MTRDAERLFRCGLPVQKDPPVQVPHSLRTVKIIINNSGDSGKPFLVLDLREKVLVFQH